MNIRDIRKMTLEKAESILRLGYWYRAWYGRVRHFFVSPNSPLFRPHRRSRTLCNKDLFTHVTGNHIGKCPECERRYKLIEQQAEVCCPECNQPIPFDIVDCPDCKRAIDES